MAELTAEEADREFLDLLRHVLGKRPLPDESYHHSRVTLDGVRRLTMPEWAAELGVTRQAIWMRRKALLVRLAEGMPAVEAYALACAPLTSQRINEQGKKRGKYRKRRPGSARWTPGAATAAFQCGAVRVRTSGPHHD